MVLTEKDRTELHQCIVEYLECQKLGDIASQLKPQLLPSADAGGVKARFQSTDSQLEKRWNTLRRLSTKNMELENQIKQLNKDLRDIQDPNTAKTKNRDMLPCEPSLVTLRGHRDSLTAVCIHPTEPIVFSASEDGSVRSWDASSKMLVATSREHLENVSAMALEPIESHILASGSNDTTVKLMDVNGGSLDCTKTLYGHDEAVTYLVWVGDSVKTLLSASRDGKVKSWDTQRGAQKHSINAGEGEWVRSISLPFPGSQSIMCCGNGTVVSFWNWTGSGGSSGDGQLSRLGTQHGNAIQCAIYSNYEADCALIPNHGSPDMKEELKKFDRQLRVQEQVTATSGSSGGNATAQLLQTYEPQLVISASRDKLILVTHIRSGSVILTIGCHDNWVRSVALSGNNKFLISCSDDGSVQVCDLSTGSNGKGARIVRKIAAHDHFVTTFAVHNGGKPLMATGSADSTLKLWPCS